jgi:nucleoside 2-deoxyribosyltransferase
MKIVYLAGPITGLSYEGATDWRDYAKKKLAEYGILGVSPMRGKEFLKNLASMPSGDQAKAGDHHGLSLPHGFVARDRLDVRRADAVLMNLLGAERVSIGTMVEVGWADALLKPVVLVMENPTMTVPDSEFGPEEWDENIHEHGFVRELTQYHNEDLDTAIETIAAILQD